MAEAAKKKKKKTPASEAETASLQRGGEWEDKCEWAQVATIRANAYDSTIPRDVLLFYSWKTVCPYCRTPNKLGEREPVRGCSMCRRCLGCGDLWCSRHKSCGMHCLLKHLLPADFNLADAAAMEHPLDARLFWNQRRGRNRLAFLRTLAILVGPFLAGLLLHRSLSG